MPILPAGGPMALLPAADRVVDVLASLGVDTFFGRPVDQLGLPEMEEKWKPGTSSSSARRWLRCRNLGSPRASLQSSLSWRSPRSSDEYFAAVVPANPAGAANTFETLTAVVGSQNLEIARVDEPFFTVDQYVPKAQAGSEALPLAHAPA